MQEPASVIFSLANLLLHIWGLGEIRKEISDEHPMKRYYVRWAYISCNAWIWSAIFHTRDTPFTEKLDYFSAGLTILYSLYFTVIRLFHLYTTLSHPASRTFYLWSGLCLGAYISHILYLSLSARFDYGYNIAANVGLGLAHNALWLAFAMPSSLSPLRRFLGRPRSYRPWYATRAAQAVVLTTLATMLELFDFPPWWRVIDAHSLWHLATAPLAVLWYDFLINDAVDAGWKELAWRSQKRAPVDVHPHGGASLLNTAPLGRDEPFLPRLPQLFYGTAYITPSLRSTYPVSSFTPVNNHLDSDIMTRYDPQSSAELGAHDHEAICPTHTLSHTRTWFKSRCKTSAEHEPTTMLSWGYLDPTSSHDRLVCSCGDARRPFAIQLTYRGFHKHELRREIFYLFLLVLFAGIAIGVLGVHGSRALLNLLLPPEPIPRTEADGY
ncbi:unnamed protein product [Peniophora sp. CBMAI 1063]|nr:unnamed protein product [Peniophora sp. CBMAI 1063]